MIEQIDHRLWHVSDLLPQEQLNEILAIQWTELPWQKENLQENWPRRKITNDDSRVRQVNRYIEKCLPTINQSLGTEFQSCHGHWWLDEPGFTCSMHTDGHLPNAMQLYWIMPSDQYGTGFYHFKNTNSLKHQFDSVPNSGYIMLNHLDPDGSQPLQWHGMFNPVPADAYRLSSYFYFYK
jgi:hypothetical protein